MTPGSNLSLLWHLHCRQILHNEATRDVPGLWEASRKQQSLGCRLWMLPGSQKSPNGDWEQGGRKKRLVARCFFNGNRQSASSMVTLVSVNQMSVRWYHRSSIFSDLPHKLKRWSWSHFNSENNWGSKMLSTLPEITELLSLGAKIQDQMSQNQKPFLPSP